MTVNWDREKCLRCVGCIGVCPKNALDYVGNEITIDENCTDCGLCVQFCPIGALKIGKR